jgi:hypothetical protein
MQLATLEEGNEGREGEEEEEEDFATARSGFFSGRPYNSSRRHSQVYSVYLLYWYTGTDTDAGVRSRRRMITTPQASAYMCMFVCMYVYTYVCMYVYIYVCVCV